MCEFSVGLLAQPDTPARAHARSTLDVQTPPSMVECTCFTVSRSIRSWSRRRAPCAAKFIFFYHFTFVAQQFRFQTPGLWNSDSACLTDQHFGGQRWNLRNLKSFGFRDKIMKRKEWIIGFNTNFLILLKYDFYKSYYFYICRLICYKKIKSKIKSFLLY